MLDIQARARATVKEYVDRSAENCKTLGYPLTEWQQRAICGARKSSSPKLS